MPGDELPEDGPVGNATVGVLVTRPKPRSYATSLDVVLIDPSTGTTQVVARLPVSGLQFAESSAYASGALYVLVEGRLFRVAPRSKGVPHRRTT